MNTEIPDKTANEPAGWIYFDAECRFCVAHRRRWGRIFERRGFVWLPLQTPGTAERLAITDQQLREAMWLELANGRKFNGVNAWAVLLRRVWCLWPVGFALALPGFNAAGRALYRWIAKNRQCLGGACAIPSHGKAKPQPRETRSVAGQIEGGERR
jgi:predicted DCC family thiol-disulfide oxidoreductase YuxK